MQHGDGKCSQRACPLGEPVGDTGDSKNNNSGKPRVASASQKGAARGTLHIGNGAEQPTEDANGTKRHQRAAEAGEANCASRVLMTSYAAKPPSTPLITPLMPGWRPVTP